MTAKYEQMTVVLRLSENEQQCAEVAQALQAGRYFHGAYVEDVSTELVEDPDWMEFTS